MTRLIAGQKYLVISTGINLSLILSFLYINIFFSFQKEIYYIAAFIFEGCCKKIQTRCSYFISKSQCKIYVLYMRAYIILDLCVKRLLSISGKLYNVMALIQDLLKLMVSCH